VLDYLARAVRQVLRTSRAEAVTLFGACIGGLLAAMYAALFPGPHLRNLILDATHPHRLLPRAPGARPLDHRPRRPARNAGGAVRERAPSEFVGSTPRPLKAITGHLGTLFGRGDRLSQNPSLATWIALNQWVSEGIPFAGEGFPQMIHDLIQRNKLVKGEFQLRGRPVDLKNNHLLAAEHRGHAGHHLPGTAG
jgi:polyhydroxyalkanoate synthase subunit PhaC